MKMTFLKHIVLLVTSVVYFNMSFAQKSKTVKRSSSTYSSENSYLNVNENSSSAGPGETLINYKNGADTYNIKMKLDKVTELYVNDKKIPADSFYVYNGVIEKIKEQIKKDIAQAKLDRKQAEKDRAQAILDRAQAEKDRQQAEKDREQAEKDRQQAQKERAKYQGQAELDRKEAEKDRAQAEKDRQQAIKDRAQAEKDRQQAELDRKQAEKDRKQAEDERALIKSMIEELVNEHIITDEKSITNLVLSAEEFTINGKKQSEELHNKYKAKYIKKPVLRIRM